MRSSEPQLVQIPHQCSILLIGISFTFWSEFKIQFCFGMFRICKVIFTSKNSHCVVFTGYCETTMCYLNEQFSKDAYLLALSSDGMKLQTDHGIRKIQQQLEHQIWKEIILFKLKNIDHLS